MMVGSVARPEAVAVARAGVVSVGVGLGAGMGVGEGTCLPAGVGSGGDVGEGRASDVEVSNTISTGRVHARAPAINTRVESIEAV